MRQNIMMKTLRRMKISRADSDAVMTSATMKKMTKNMMRNIMV